LNGVTVLALKTNGSLWGWGYNVTGNTGTNTNQNRSSPVQVGTDPNWAKISGSYQSFAIKTTGALWAIGGYGGYGGLGTGTTISRSAPVQIGSATNWSAVSSGLNNSAGLRSV